MIDHAHGSVRVVVDGDRKVGGGFHIGLTAGRIGILKHSELLGECLPVSNQLHRVSAGRDEGPDGWLPAGAAHHSFGLASANAVVINGTRFFPHEAFFFPDMGIARRSSAQRNLVDCRVA
ncbi:MAG: hypothetical protein DMG63_07105 [Acidobacteria bacterium]|nr:MAG: hypothetical protein DMG63_07105 [Acidobacteriota bacterium]